MRILVNEYVAAALGIRLGAAIPGAAVLDISPAVAGPVALEGGAAWQPGAAFASLLIDSSAPYVPDMLREATDRVALAKVAVLDTWLGQSDGRQARATRVGGAYDVRAVDFGHSLGGPDWTAADLAARAVPTVIADPNAWLGSITADELEAMAADVASIADSEIEELAASIPAEWGITEEDRVALARYFEDRRPVLTALVETLAGKAP